jgi:hypothetical protein
MSLGEAVGRAGTVFVAAWCVTAVTLAYGVRPDVAFGISLGAGYLTAVCYSRYVWRSHA